MDTLGPILALVMLGGLIFMMVNVILSDQDIQARVAADRAGADAWIEGVLRSMALACGSTAQEPTPPESPAQRQLREWQERLDARHPPERPTPAELDRLLTPFPPMPVPAPQYTPPESPPGMVHGSAR